MKELEERRRQLEQEHRATLQQLTQKQQEINALTTVR